MLLGTEQRRVDTKEKWPYLRNIGVLTVFSASMAVKSAILGIFVAILAGNRPYKGCGNRYGWILAKNVINNPLTYLAGAVLGATLYLDFGSADVGVEGCLNGFADQGALFV